MTKVQEARLKALGVPAAKIAKLKAAKVPWARILKMILALLAAFTDDEDEK